MAQFQIEIETEEFEIEFMTQFQIKIESMTQFQIEIEPMTQSHFILRLNENIKMRLVFITIHTKGMITRAIRKKVWMRERAEFCARDSRNFLYLRARILHLARTRKKNLRGYPSHALSSSKQHQSWYRTR